MSRYRTLVTALVLAVCGLTTDASAVIWDPGGRYERDAAADDLQAARKRAAGPFTAIRITEHEIGRDRCGLSGPVIGQRGSEPLEGSATFTVSVPCRGRPDPVADDAGAGQDGPIDGGGGAPAVLSNERVRDARIVVVPRRAHARTGVVSLDEILFYRDANDIPASPFSAQVRSAELAVKRLSSLHPDEPAFRDLAGSWIGRHPSGLTVELAIDDGDDHDLRGTIQVSHSRESDRSQPLSDALDWFEQLTFKDHTSIRASLAGRYLDPLRAYVGRFVPLPWSSAPMWFMIEVPGPDEIELDLYWDEQRGHGGSPPRPAPQRRADDGARLPDRARRARGNG